MTDEARVTLRYGRRGDAERLLAMIPRRLVEVDCGDGDIDGGEHKSRGIEDGPRHSGNARLEFLSDVGNPGRTHRGEFPP